MHRLRERWVALLGGALLLALSVSTVVGADPVDTDEPRGRTVAAFVHSLIFGQDEAPNGNLDEEVVEAEVTDEVTEDTDASVHDACVSEVAHDKAAVGGPNDNHGGAVSDAARETCRQDEPVADDEELLEEADTHGACVSAVAKDKAAVGGPNDNHGGAVSEAARETCREDEPVADDEEPLEEADTHGACVSAVAQDKDAVGGPNDNHGGAVSEAARETCHEDAADAEGAGGDTDAGAEATDASAEAPRERGNSAFGHDRGNRGGGRP